MRLPIFFAAAAALGCTSAFQPHAHRFSTRSILYRNEKATAFAATVQTDYGTVDGSFDDEEDDLRVGAASLRSIIFCDLTRDTQPQLLSNFLMELGACSSSITDADRGTDAERALFDEFATEHMTRTAVTTHVWDRCNVSATFAASADLNWVMELVRDSFPDLPDYSVEPVEENKDWVLHVQKSWKPIVLPPFVLRFPWHDDETVSEAIRKHVTEAGADDIDESKFVSMELQGGIAFGTGEHPTTQLCLDWIADVIEPGHLVMDYGAGSGVLGMGACKLDDSVRAVGVDIDVDAVHIANANAEINDVRMTSYLSPLVHVASDGESASVRMRAHSSKRGDSAEVLPEDLGGAVYDVCVANILAGPLVSLAEDISGLLNPKGHLGLSGIMASQSEMILKAYEPFFDEMKVSEERDGWVLITGVRKSQ